MTLLQNQSPRFLFDVAEIRPSREFHQRPDRRSRRWKPPGPRHSNVLEGNRISYRYDNWQVQSAEPTNSTKLHFKTFSLYADQDRFWVYPRDATERRVGSGEDNPRISGGRGRNDNQSTPDDPNDDFTDDRNPLSFHWHTEDFMHQRSYARARQPKDTVQLQTPNSITLPELLPDQYLAPRQGRIARQHEGGLAGDLPLLIGLIALSVRPEFVDWALRGCLRQRYNPHGQQRGAGWTTYRGVVVRVAYEPTPPAPDRRGQRSYVPAHDPVFQRLEAFERGRNVHGPFAN